jgi:trehalose/maltose hydrolase-like predicted phosphorylase
MAVIFPDIEKTLVAYLNDALAASASEVAQDVRVATKKAQPDEALPEKEAVLTAAYNAEQNYVTKTASVTIEVYADTYANANALSLLIAALIPGCVGEEIKMAEVRLGPVRIGEDNTQEKRYLDVGLVVKGTDL